MTMANVLENPKNYNTQQATKWQRLASKQVIQKEREETKYHNYSSQKKRNVIIILIFAKRDGFHECCVNTKLKIETASSCGV